MSIHDWIKTYKLTPNGEIYHSLTDKILTDEQAEIIKRYAETFSIELEMLEE